MAAAVIAAYFVLTVGIGLLHRRRAQTATAYEGHRLGMLTCVAVGAGEWLGGTATTGVSEYGYLYGISGAWYTVANALGICFLALCFARLFRRLDTATVPEIIGRYLGRRARMMSGVFLLLVLAVVGVSQMIAVGTLGESLLGLPPVPSICLFGGGVLLYTCLGGMNAIGATNVMHLVVMYGGMAAALIVCLSASGGMSGLAAALPSEFRSPAHIGEGRVSSWLVASVLGACTAQAGLQPVLRSRDERTAVASSFCIALLVAPFGVVTALLGMAARTQFPGLENAKLALPALLLTLHPALAGAVLAAVLAAVLSTASPIFLSCGTLFTRDLYGGTARGRMANGRALLRVSRLATLGAGAVCVAAAVFARGNAVLDIVYFAYSLRGSLFIVLLLGIFWKGMTGSAACAAMLATAAVGAGWVMYRSAVGEYPIPGVGETYAAVLTALAVSLAVGLAGRKNVRHSAEDDREETNMEEHAAGNTVAECLAAHASATPDKVAVIAEGRETSYAELYALARGCAGWLQDAGVSHGDIVVARAGQTLEYVALYLGVHLAGGVIASVERGMGTDGLLSVARHLGARTVITDDVDAQMHPELRCLSRKGLLDAARAQSVPDSPPQFPSPEDAADILFTTGTTGASKGVELSHHALAAAAGNLIAGCGYRPDTVMIVPGPLNHANAIRKVFASVVNGSTAYLLNGMANMPAFFAALDYPQGSIACCLPPAAIRAIFQLTRDRLGQYAERIDFIESATSPLPEPDKERLCALLPHTRLYNNYGSSEAASVCMYDYSQYRGRTGCVGRATPNSRVFIVDDERRPMLSSPDAPGLVACGGDVVMTRYVNEPELTRQVLADGVVYTSDIGYIDAEGFVYVVGRSGDVINVGGLKVAPAEVESAALGFDGIEDCICVPVEDAITGHAIKLLVVLRDGARLEPKAISDFLRARLEGHKVPRFYEQVDHVQRTYNGKPDRRAYGKASKELPPPPRVINHIAFPSMNGRRAA